MNSIPQSSQVSEGSDVDIRHLAAALLRIHSQTSSAVLTKILGADSAHTTQQELHQLVQEIAQTCAQVLTTQNMRSYERLTALLRPDEYPLPPELQTLHPSLVEHLRSSKTNEHFTHSGVLFFGIPGTGKTEYTRFLAHEVQENADVVVVNMNLIRDASSPGDTLFQLYRHLDEVAQQSGRYVVALLDEFDKMMNKFSQVNVQTKRTESHQAVERRSEFTQTDEKQVSHAIDEKGEALLSTFKTILSGTGNIQRVFTIATTNQQELPAELTRDGRLKPVALKAFGMPKLPDRGPSDPDYRGYHRTLPRLLSVLQATCVRLTGQPQPLLQDLLQKLQDYFNGEECQSILQIDEEDYQSSTHGGAILATILRMLSVDYTAIPQEVRRSFFIAFDDTMTQVKWGGSGFITHRAIPEFKQMSEMTCSKVAAYFKERQELFASSDPVVIGNAVAELIFPQLQKPV